MRLFRQPFRSLILLLLSLLVIYCAGQLLPLATGYKILMEWLQQPGPAGQFAYVAVYIIATLLLLPLSPLAIGAGYVFGLYYGFIVTLVAATIGAVIAFMLARTLLRSRFYRLFKANAGLAAVEKSINDQGGTIVFLLRLSPIIPSQILNYLCGVTGIRLWSYALATLLGKAPLSFLLSYIGALTARTIVEDQNDTFGYLPMFALGLISTGLACWLVIRGARRRLRQQGVADV